MYATFTDIGLLHVDRDSRLLWALPGRFHHALTRGTSGELLVLTRERRSIPRINSRAEVLEDFIREHA